MQTGSPPARALERLLAAIPPASGAVVMGTGIVSIGLSLDGHEMISRVLLISMQSSGWRSSRRVPRATARTSAPISAPGSADLRRRHGRARHTAHAAPAGIGQVSRCS
jgi:hypothetical protein